ncbi:WD40-repeat-containing domain protein [Lenzites betulinus]|nr:WD40-repeat-containing domain protein [Lenzites betulinus]
MVSEFSTSAYVEHRTLVGGHSDTVNCLAFSPSGTHLASGGDDHAFVIWNALQGRLLYRFMFKSAVDALLWHPIYPDTVIVGCENGTISQVHEFSVTNSEHYELNLGVRSTIHCLDYDIHTAQLAIGMGEEVHVTKEKTQNRYGGDVALPSPADPVITGAGEWRLRAIALKFHDRGTALIVSYLGHGISCWDITSGASLWHIPMPSTKPNIGGAAISIDHRYIAVYNLIDGLDLYALGTKKTKPKMSYKIDKAPRSKHRLQVNFVHGGRAIFSGTTSGKISLWDVRTGEVCQNLEHAGEFTTCSIPLTPAYR